MKVRITNLKARLLAHPQPAYLIAAAAGIDPTTLSKLARGKMPIAVYYRRRLADVLECDPDDLIGDTEYELTSIPDE
jgi:transcriptional regulator with XRE-family HTH domain